MSADGTGLTEFQLEVAHVFFELPASHGFLLAGGAGLVASGLTTRPTQDLDFFKSTPSVTAARDEFERAASARGWTVRRLRDHEDFVRLMVGGPEDLLIDLCLDSTPVRPSVVTVAGPTFSPDELAGRKVVALFSRAEARDFADVHALLERYSRSDLLELAAEIDAGFDPEVFAQMLRSVERHDADRLRAAGADPDELRTEFLDWACQLS